MQLKIKFNPKQNEIIRVTTCFQKLIYSNVISHIYSFTFSYFALVTEEFWNIKMK